MHVLDLFSGIGGASLGLHWAGMRTAAFCERDAFCRGVLARHWPGVPVYPDIRDLGADRLRRDGIAMPGLVVGGFPCQDVSVAGQGAGVDGARSGLWTDLVRLVAECRPRWVVVENVPGLRSRGADRVLAGLEALGYACWPFMVGAVHAGAPHRRQRAWIVAYAPGARLEVGQCGATGSAPGLPAERRGGWPAEPLLRGMADGVPAGLDRLRTPRIKALGNAMAPANAAMIGRAILAADAVSAGSRT